MKQKGVQDYSITKANMAFVDIRDSYNETIKNININTFSFGTVFITEIPNPFKLNIQNKRTELHGKYLIDYARKNELDETNYCIIYNGKLIKEKEEQENILVKENDIIVYFPYQEFSAIAAVASIIMSYIGTSVIATAIAYTLATGLIIGGMMLINKMLAPDIPETNMDSNISESKTYTWEGISTNRDINSVIPIVYGTQVVGGTEINKFSYYENGDDWLAIQLALGYGEIEEISSADIYFNGQPYNNYVSSVNDGVFYYRDGTFNQSIMKGFDDTSYNNGNVTETLTYNESYIFESESDNIDRFKLHFEFMEGLYHLYAKKNRYLPVTVSYSIGYRIKGESTWNYFNPPIYQKQFSISTLQTFRKRRRDYYRTVQKYVWSDWEIYNNSNISHAEELELQKQNRIRYRNVNIGGNNTLSYTANKTSKVKFLVSSDDLGVNLTKGKYEFIVTRLSPIPSNTKYHLYKTDMTFSYLEEINTTDLNYGGVSQLGIKIKATDSIQNQQPNVTTKVTRKDLDIYTSDDYSESFKARSNNPAWVCYDILTNPFYGAKIKPSQVDFERFSEWASFCDLEFLREETIISNNEVYTIDRLIYNSSERTLKVYKSEILQEISSIELSTYNKGLSRIIITDNSKNTFQFNTLISITEDVDINGEFYLFSFSEYNSNFDSSNIANIDFLLDFASTDFITLTNLGHPLQLNFNGVFDTLTNPWDACQKVGKIGRGQILLRGNKYSCTFDGIQPISYMFNVGDIKKESFNISYTPLADLATELEIQYADTSIRNELNTITILDQNLTDTTLNPKTSTVNAIGITTKEEAIIFGRYMLATTKFQRRTVSFETNIKGLPCEVGDVVAVQNDIPLWGSGGRIQEVTPTSVILEEPVTLISDKDYTLKIQVGNIFQDYYITNTDLTDTLEIPLLDTSGISQYNSYIFGENNNDALLIRVTGITRTDREFNFKIEGSDYNPSILDFNYSNDQITTIEPSVLEANRLLTFEVLDEVQSSDDGRGVINLIMSWTAISTSTYDIYAIPHNDDPELEIPFIELDNIQDNRIYIAKGVKGNSYIAKNVGLLEIPYRVYIQEVDNPSNFLQVLYTVDGKQISPLDIDNITVTESGNEFTFNITYLGKASDFKHYNLYLEDKFYGSFNQDAFKTDIIYGLDTKNFKIEAEDSSGNKSEPYLISKTAEAPPKADYFFCEITDTKNIRFTFDCLSKPLDFSGYEIRYQYGLNYDWNSATKIQKGVITSSPYLSHLKLQNGLYTALLKTVDSAGNLSKYTSKITFNIEESLFSNLVYTKDFHPTFVGDYTNCYLEDNKLITEINASEFWKGDSNNYWDSDFDMYWYSNSSPHWDDTLNEFWGVDQLPFWDNEYTYRSIYETSFITDAKGILDFRFIGKGTPTYYIRNRDILPFWEENGTEFWEEDIKNFWTIPNYSLYSSGYEVVPFVEYDLQVVFESTNTVISEIEEFSLFIDAQDIFESFEDVNVPISGYSLNLIKTFSKIKSVNVTVQDDGGNARISKVDKSGTPYEVYCYDENNNLTSGTVDIIIQGY
jgi:hypothetical protein